MIIVTDSTFKKEVLEHRGIVVVDFYADWCATCKSLMLVLEDLAKHYEGKIKFVKIDTDKNTIVPSNYSVKSLPTLIFFKNKYAIDVLIGVKTKTYITSCITNALLDDKEDSK